MSGCRQNSVMDKQYRIIYTESAIRDMEEKASYISLNLRDPGLAEIWYSRLKTEILKDLTQFPYKYPLYHAQKWSAKGVRLFIFRNDVILYSVDETEQVVYIRTVCTKGRNLTAHLDKST